MPSHDSSAGIGRRLLCGLIGIALVLRLGWGLSRPVDDLALTALPDQLEYLTLARNVLHGQGLWFIDPRFGDRVYAFRMPGYPLFVAACAGNVRVIRVAQALLDSGTVLAVFLLACQVMGSGRRRAPLLAAAIVAFNPMLIYVSGLILSETLFTAMLTWGMVLLLAGFGRAAPDEHAGRPARVLVWLAGGLLLALAVLVRPSAGALPLVLGIGAVFVNSRGRTAYQSSPAVAPLGRWPLPVGSTMLFLVALVLTPWVLRNYKVLHRFIWTDTNSGITLFDGFNPDATGASDQRFVKHLPQLRLMDEAGRSQYLTIRAIDFIRRHPRRVAELALAKAARTWSPVPLSDQFGNPGYRTIALGYSVPFDLLVLFGLLYGNMRRSAKVFLLLPAIYLTAVHALTIGSLRYRLPAEAALAVMAACAFAKREDVKT